MAIATSIAVSVSVSGDGILPETYVPPQSPMLNQAAPGGVPQSYVLAPGNNTITVPAGSLRAVLVPPATSSNAKLAKVVNGDAGFPFTNDFVIVPVAGLASIVVNATAAETIRIAWC